MHLGGGRSIRALGDVCVLMQGNPTVTRGQGAFGRNRAIWKNFTTSVFDTANCWASP
jgi:hypothetical protein